MLKLAFSSATRVFSFSLSMVTLCCMMRCRTDGMFSATTIVVTSITSVMAMTASVFRMIRFGLVIFFRLQRYDKVMSYELSVMIFFAFFLGILLIFSYL